MTQQATHIQRRLDRIAAGKEKPAEIGYTRKRKPRFEKRPGTKTKPLSFRGRRRHNTQIESSKNFFTKAEWARRKAKRKARRRS